MEKVIAENNHYRIIAYQAQGEITLKFFSIPSNGTFEYWHTLTPVVADYLAILENTMRRNETYDLFVTVQSFLQTNSLLA